MCGHETLSILTSWGLIKVKVGDGGLERCALPRLEGIPKDSFAILESGDDPYSNYIRRLFKGEKPQRPPIGNLEGTPFQIRVWKGMLSIPHGETCSYKELATQIGSPSSCRAVANACGRNPVPLFIPCHRIIRTDGDPGGFSSGVAWKRRLLDAEQVNCK